MTVNALWTVDTMTAAMRARREGALPDSVGGISIDSRTLAPGDAFFAIAGDNRDGHAFVDAALKEGAGLAVVAASKRDTLPTTGAPLLVVDDVLEALRDLARASRARLTGKVIAVTGSVGKTSTKEALRLVLSREGETHASAASYNNHWGVPLSLARCPADARFAVFELGMNHAGEIGPLSQLVKPDLAMITTIAPVHLEYFASVDAIADAKAEIFEGLASGGIAILNRDNAQFTRLANGARDANARIVSFGEAADADARLIKCVLQPDYSTVQANILGNEITYKLGAPGRHLVMNSLGVLAVTKLAGADLAIAAMALADLKPASGRGTRIALDVRGSSALLIDESYNANPVSMAAAIALLGQADPGPRGRRIAVLGDMLELGAQSDELHAGLARLIVDHAVDLVFCSGPAMRNLWEALPSNRRGGYATDSGALEPQVLDAVSGGDAIMIKGSFGSKMTPIVKALQRKYAPRAAMDAAQG